MVHDPIITPDQIEKAGCKSVSLEELYRKSDYITVHIPRLKGTMGFISKEAFEQMKDGVMVINCARGGIIDEDALNQALKSGKFKDRSAQMIPTRVMPGKSCPFATICVPTSTSIE